MTLTRLIFLHGFKMDHLQVIDEIDGALSGAEGKGAIDALLEIVRWSSIHLDGGDIQGLTK